MIDRKSYLDGTKLLTCITCSKDSTKNALVLEKVKENALKAIEGANKDDITEEIVVPEEEEFRKLKK